MSPGSMAPELVLLNCYTRKEKTSSCLQITYSLVEVTSFKLMQIYVYFKAVNCK